MLINWNLNKIGGKIKINLYLKEKEEICLKFSEAEWNIKTYLISSKLADASLNAVCSTRGDE